MRFWTAADSVRLHVFPGQGLTGSTRYLGRVYLCSFGLVQNKVLHPLDNNKELQRVPRNVSEKHFPIGKGRIAGFSRFKA